MGGKLGSLDLLGFDNLATVLDALAYHAFENQVDLGDLTLSDRLPQVIFGRKKIKVALTDLAQLGFIIFDDPSINLQAGVSWDENASQERRQQLWSALVAAGIDAEDLPALDDTAMNWSEPAAGWVEETPVAAEFSPTAGETAWNANDQTPFAGDPAAEFVPPTVTPAAGTGFSRPAPSPSDDETQPAAPPGGRLAWGQKGKSNLPKRTRDQVEIPPEAAPVPPISAVPEPPPAPEPPPTESERPRWGAKPNLPVKKAPSAPNAGTPPSPTEPPSKVPTWERGGPLPAKQRPGGPLPPAPEASETDKPSRVPPASGSSWQRSGQELPNRTRPTQPTTTPTTPPSPRKPGAPRPAVPSAPTPPTSPLNRGGGRMRRPGINVPVTPPATPGLSAGDENTQALIMRLLEDRDFAVVDVATAEAYAQAILEYIARLKDAGLDTDPATGVRLSQLLAQLLARLQGTDIDED